MSKDEVRPFIRVYTSQKRRLIINLFTHDVLGQPPYLEFYWSDEKKLLLIAPLFQKKHGCYCINESVTQTRSNEIRVQDAMFITGLINRLDWNLNAMYKVFGKFMPDMNMVAFHMLNPIIVSETDDASVSPNNRQNGTTMQKEAQQ